MITRLLVANRGEIARRVFRTCRDLGIVAIAVHSDADATQPHVAEADLAVRLPGAAPADTYLRIDLLVDAAERADADAVHPGYGFLSERADFARAVLDAGLTWVGPAPEAISAMADKVAAKALVAAAGVPVLPVLAPEDLSERDLPVLVKAVAGGGGRGMRIVRRLADLPSALAAARAESGSAFGDPRVFCERYLPTGHHVEIQLLADHHGTVWTLGERECSIQRRHQKVIEESPSPLVERRPDLRERLATAAEAAARAVGYRGAGTVEFLADEDGRCYFLEMNTRIQVEHPVTECVTGLDLVALQLAVAEGAQLPAQPPPARGSAVEARLYAEDPAAAWTPQAGTVRRLAVPSTVAAFTTGPAERGVRVDSAVEPGTAVGEHYDPLLAKVIAWAPGRSDAVRLLTRALRDAELHGPRTNRDLLVRVLGHPDFLAGHTDTSFLAGHPGLTVPLVDPDSERAAALAAALALDAADRAAAPVLATVPSGWRNVVSAPQARQFSGPATVHAVRYRFGRGGLEAPDDPDVVLIDRTPDEVLIDRDGVRERYRVHRCNDEVYVDGPHGGVRFTVVPRFPEPDRRPAAGALVAPLPGTVTAVSVSVGDRVAAGRPVLTLEAMKMQHILASPGDGVVREVNTRPGQQVQVGTVLVVVRPDGEERA